MKGVTGIGGIFFFQARNPEGLFAWYEKHLGMKRSPASTPGNPSWSFEWRDVQDPEQKGMTLWALFPRDTKYFGQSGSPFMFNYRVENLDELLEELAAAGVEIDPHRENYDYGRFAWIVDPEGNRIELWEPPKK